MVYYYNTARPLSSAFLILSGTASKVVLKSMDFYVYVFIQLLLNILVSTEVIVIPEAGQISMDAVLLSTSLQVWLMVFFAKNCYDRYETLYEGCMEFDESVKTFIQQMSIVAPYVSLRPGLHLAAKYMVAAVLLFFLGVTGGKVSENEWDFIKAKGLLDAEELEYLKTFPGHRGLLLSSWSMRVVDQMIRTKEMKATFEAPEMAWVFHRLQEHNWICAHKMRAVADLLAMPIPFAYYHLLNILLFLNFIAVGYAVTCATKSLMVSIPYGVFVFVFMALRVLSASLADPFREQGSDALHLAFPLVSFTNYNFDHAAMLVSSIDSYWWDDKLPHLFKDGHDPGQERACAPNKFGFFSLDEVACRPTHEQIYEGEDPEVDPTAGCEHKIRGEQVFVAYKWDPDGQTCTNRKDSYAVKWLQRAYWDTVSTIEQHLGIKSKETMENSATKEAPAVPTSTMREKSLTKGMKKVPAGMRGASSGIDEFDAALFGSQGSLVPKYTKTKETE